MTQRSQLIARRLLEDYHAAPAVGSGVLKKREALLKRAMTLIQYEAEEAGMVDTWTLKKEMVAGE